MKQGDVFKRCACKRSQWPRCEHPYWHSVKVPNPSKPQGFEHKRESLVISTLGEARDARHDRRKLLKASAGQAGDLRLTLNDVADLYAADRADKGKDYHLAKLRGLTVPGPKGATVVLGTKRIADVTTADIDAAVAAYRKASRAGKAGGVVGVRKLLQTARHLFNWAIRKGHATSTPFRREGVTLISVKPGKARKRRLVGDEEDRLLEAADQDTKDRMIAQLETGCRPGEIRTLQWSEVRGNFLVILAEKAKDRDERHVRITATLRKVLDERRNGPDGAPLPPSAYVFGNAVGEPVSKEKVNELWRATCKAAGVENLTMHDLRRTFGSRFLEAGNDVHAVRDVLGHSSVTMTNTYLSTEEAQQAEAFERFEAAERRRKLRVLKHA